MSKKVSHTLHGRKVILKARMLKQILDNYINYFFQQSVLQCGDLIYYILISVITVTQFSFQRGCGHILFETEQ